MVDQICTGIDNGAYTPAVRTITAAGDVPYPNAHFNRNGAMHAGGSLQLRQNGTNAILGQITLNQLRAFDQILLNNAQSPTTYRNIKNNPHWQMTYHTAQRIIPFVSKDGTLSQRLEWTIPCRECGVVVLFRLITIDHYKPQAGDPLDPIYKLFRVCGYTEDRPTGSKGMQTQDEIGTAAGGIVGGGTGAYALNPVGVIVYSLFAGSGYNNNLRNLSMHHFINLRPVCSFCNPSIGAR